MPFFWLLSHRFNIDRVGIHFPVALATLSRTTIVSHCIQHLQPEIGEDAISAVKLSVTAQVNPFSL